MIVGIGTDLADVRRIERTLERFGDHFVRKIFTETERSAALRRPRSAHAYALRFAAKEACSKALGTGFRQGVFWRDMAVANLPSGKPTMTLTGGAQARLNALVPPGWRAHVELSHSDEDPMALAFVVIWAEPRDEGVERLRP